jgi:uncharacterized membrane protein (UPF0127 family)
MTVPTLPGKSRPRQRALIVITLALALLTASFFLTNKKETDTIIVTFPSGREIETEVADTPEKLLFGLAFREGLPPNTGMLYIFDASDRHRVRTKAFKIPVDIVWVDDGRRVVHMVERADPCAEDPCPLYGPPPEKARYVIETNAGFIKEEGLSSGAELKFTLRL